LEELTLDADRDQGTAVFLLESEGEGEAADLLELSDMTYGEERWGFNDEEGEWWSYKSPRLAVRIEVDPQLLKDYTNAIKASIAVALDKVAGERRLEHPLFVPRRVEENWREARRQARLTGINNQGARRPLPENHPVKDGLKFRSWEEVAVYEALLRKQASLSETDTITILPNSAARVVQRTIEPDFIVIYGGRAGGIEVDGPHHNGRAAADHTRSNLLRDGGVRLVERIVVEDTVDRLELDCFVGKFLDRLARQ
jgi:hypothetical protein